MVGVSLRARLVAALAILLAAGLGLFGFATYSIYARQQHQRLDEGLRSRRADRCCGGCAPTTASRRWRNRRPMARAASAARASPTGCRARSTPTPCC